MPFAKVQSGNVATYTSGPGDPIVETNHFVSNTTAGNLLVLIVAASQETSSGSSTPVVTPTLGTPTTPGFSWTLAGTKTSNLVDLDDYSIQSIIAVYFIENADAMASTVLTTCSTNLQEDDGSATSENELVCDLSEWSGFSTDVLDAVVSALGVASNQSAGTIDLTETDLLLVVATALQDDDGSGVPGPGFTALDAAALDVFQGQYNLSAAAGSQATAWTGESVSEWPWAAVAVGFKAGGGIPPPTVISVVPPSGPIAGGTPVTITGTNFIPPLTVAFDTDAPTDVVVVSGSTITCVTPAHTAGGVPVSVTTDFGTGSLADGYTYIDPELEVTPLSLNFTALQGGPNPASQSVSVTNGTVGILNWAVSSDSAWLSASPGSGTAPASVAANISIAGLTFGTYTGHLTFTASGSATNTPQTVTVNLVITAPILQVAPLSFGFAGNVGQTNLPSQTFNISNGNGGTLNWTTASDQSWLSASLASGTGNTTVAAQVNMSGLGMGTYTGHITVAASGAEDSPQVITVTLDVSQPILVVAPLTLEYTAAQFAANPPSQNIAISNGNGGVLNWDIVSDSAWLTTGVSSGVNAATVAVSVSSAGFGVGTYTGHLTVTAPGALDSPQIVTVTLVITPAGGGGANCVPVGGNGVFINDLDLYIGPATALYTNMVPTLDLAVNESEANGRHGIIVDFNDSDGLYSRDLGVILTWPIASGTVLDLYQPSIIASEDDLYNRFSYHFLIDALGLVGYGHIRQLNIAHNATAPMNLLLTFDEWPDINITIPPSSGGTVKTKVIPPVQKFKMVEGFLSSSEPFMLWGESCELSLGQWGRSGPYKVIKPFAG